MTRFLLQDNEATVKDLPPGVQTGMALAVVALVATAGVMSGLTLGLLSLDRLDLEVMLRTGNKKQQKFAKRLFPMVQHPHWVLATLVITNTLAGMALPLCLDRLVNVAAALALSTTAVVLFGELIPQAICSRYGLSIGGYAAPFVRFLMWCTAPISWPIAKLLDIMLGKENFTFGKRQIRAFVDLHRESAGMGGPLNEEEFHVIQGVLDLGKKKAFKAMTPLEKVFMLSTDDILDRPTLHRILDTGHSRIPVYRGQDKQDIMGLILVKELFAVVGLAPPGSGPVPITALKMRDLPALPVDTPMTDLLNLFQTGHSHMALLLAEAGRAESKLASTYRCSSSAGSFTSSCSSSENGIHRGSSSSSSSGSSDIHPGSPRSARSHRVSSLLQCLSSKTFRKRSKSHDSTINEAAMPSASAAVGDVSLPDHNLADVNSTHTYPADTGSTDHQTNSHNTNLGDSSTNIPVNHPGQVVIDIGGGSRDNTAAAAAPVGDDNSLHWKITAVGPHAAMAAAAAAAVASAATSAGRDGEGGHLKHQNQQQQAQQHVVVGGDTGGALFEGNVPVGIITLEDVLEELMQEEIVDETDTFIDNEKTCRVNARVLAMSLPPAMRRLLTASQQHHLQQWQQQQAAATPSDSAAAAGSAVGHIFRSSPVAGVLSGTSPQAKGSLATKSFPLSGAK